jgi:hypothetical protein
VLRKKLEAVVTEMYEGRGFVLLRGLPVQRYSDDDVGLIFWGMGRYMGSPLYQNPQGEILGHVYDHGRTYGNIDVRGYETNAYLPYHTDAGDVVGLLCLRRGVEGGLSSIVSSTTVHNEIAAQHPEYLGLLYNGFYYIRREAALTERGVSDRPIPVFGHSDGVVQLPLHPQPDQRRRREARRAADHARRRRRSTSRRAERAPDLRSTWICSAATSSSSTTTRLLHSRTGFVDGPEPHQKRHMLRLWLKFPKPCRSAGVSARTWATSPRRTTPCSSKAEAIGQCRRS